MATNTAALKTFAQQTRAKLISLIKTKMQYVLNADTAELRGYEHEIAKLRKEIAEKTEKNVLEEVAYTWFNRVMALRFMDANGYNAPMIVTPVIGQTRPEILQDAMGGSIDEELMLTQEEKLLPEAKLYRKLLVAVCNRKMHEPMPFLFENISDYTELLLPDDLLSDQSFVSDIRNGMTDEDCQNVELMGWLYQFYITDRKADAEAKKSTKGGLKSDEQAAATQLFTPHWVVRYMVENSLGRIWMTLHPESHLVDNMPYYIATPEGQTDNIPEDIHSVQDIRFIDPCMGSGHILVYAFDLFTKMYEEEGLQQKEIPTLILRNNLYGIDIDKRCYQLASFALTMKARAYFRRYLRHTVNPNVIALENIDHDTIDSAGAWGQKSLMWQFEHIDTIGSLLKVTPEECAAIHVEDGFFGERQQLMKTQAEYLLRKYHCVVTNPPYLGKGFSEELKNYIQKIFPDSKTDTMATFMERCYDMCCTNGKYAMINMHSWMFLSSYEKLRNKIIDRQHIETMLHFGPHLFDELPGEVVQSTSFVIRKCNKNEFNCDDLYGIYFRLTDGNQCIDKENSFKDALKNHTTKKYFGHVIQSKFKSIPGCNIGYWLSQLGFELFATSTIKDFAFAGIGMRTGDNARFLRRWYEVDFYKLSFSNSNFSKWVPYNKGGEFRKWYGNNDFVVNWENDGFEIKENTKLHYPELGDDLGWKISNESYYFLPGITWTGVTTGKFNCRLYPEGFIFDSGANGMFEYEGVSRLVLAAYLNSPVANEFLKVLNPTINYGCGTIRKIPFINEEKDNIEKETKFLLDISKSDWDDHETSWDFRRNPLYEQFLLSMDDDLQNVVPPSTPLEGLLQYDVPEAKHPLSTCMKNYKDKWEVNFMCLHDNEEELNRQFIEIYGLQDELTPDVPLDEITILQKGEKTIEDNHIVWHDDVIIKQFVSWLIGCFMGRYSVDKPGLIIASQGQKIEDLDLPAQTLEIDDDGIIPVIQEPDFFADDMTQRIEAAVKTLFGEQHFYENMKYIKQCLGQELRDYLYKNFYADHQQMYSVKGAKRPIYWMFSSQMGDKKKKGYFKALVYMHRLEPDTLSKLHADYVHPYLKKIEQQLIEAEDDTTRDDLSQAQHNRALKIAEELRTKVREVKAFENELVEMASARITIDLDDGVKANYPKFYPLVEPIKGLDKVED